MLIDPPVRLPVSSLSVSSIRTFKRCPERWRRRYIDGEYEAISPAAIAGSAVGRAEAEHYQHQLDEGRGLLVSDVLDVFSDEWDTKVDEENGRGGIDWEDEKPGRVKDSGARVLGLYHRDVAPTVRPLAVERKFVVDIPGVEWTFNGYLDLESEVRDGVAVDDFKVRSPGKGIITPDEAADDLQATGYLAAVRAELEAGAAVPVFRFHNLVRAPHLEPRHVIVTPTQRTHAQLDAFFEQLYRVAAEIAWRVENDVWDGAPDGAWWCSERWCGFWHECPLGGAQRPKLLLPPRPARRPRRVDALAAVTATTRRDGTTTVARVAHHLGITPRSAQGYLRGLVQAGQVASERPVKRYKTKPDVPLPGPNVYRVVEPDTLEQDLEASLTARGVEPVAA